MVHVLDTPTGRETLEFSLERIRGIDVGVGLEEVTTHFRAPPSETPIDPHKGFNLRKGVVVVDLMHDIGCGESGEQQPTDVLYSTDSTNPCGARPLAPFVLDLMCNPDIICDLFLSNPEADIGERLHNHDGAVMELERILGSGYDISVELSNPFGKDFSEILKGAARFREILSP